MLIQNSILALLGTAVGTLLVLWGNSFIRNMGRALPRQTELRLDLRVLGFAALISFVTRPRSVLLPSSWQCERA